MYECTYEYVRMYEYVRRYVWSCAYDYLCMYKSVSASKEEDDTCLYLRSITIGKESITRAIHAFA